MISTSGLKTCTVFSNKIGTLPYVQLLTLSGHYQCVHSSVRIFVMTKLADNVETTSYQRNRRRRFWIVLTTHIEILAWATTVELQLLEH